jgi:hypothetical protein
MMKNVLTALVLIPLCMPAFGQQVQIPTVQSCNFAKAQAAANVYLSKRDDINSTGTMDVTVKDVGCDPINGDGHPDGTITMRFSLSESQISDMEVTLIEQMTTVGKHTPTSYLSGRCRANSGTIPCHFWLMLADNTYANVPGTPDVISVLVLDKKGNTLTYGTGPVKYGDVSVTQY